MTRSLKYILSFACLTILLLGSVAVYNYMMDPMCYYRCEDIDLSRKTKNVYYQVFQTLEASRDAEAIILGSSRAERVPPRWVERVTQQKTLNLAKGGADLLLKIALSNEALKSNKNLKRVIWMADYFELLPATTDAKVLWTPVIQKNLPPAVSQVGWRARLKRVQGLGRPWRPSNGHACFACGAVGSTRRGGPSAWPRHRQGPSPA